MGTSVSTGGSGGRSALVKRPKKSSGPLETAASSSSCYFSLVFSYFSLVAAPARPHDYTPAGRDGALADDPTVRIGAAAFTPVVPVPPVMTVTKAEVDAALIAVEVDLRHRRHRCHHRSRSHSREKKAPHLGPPSWLAPCFSTHQGRRRCRKNWSTRREPTPIYLSFIWLLTCL